MKESNKTIKNIKIEYKKQWIFIRFIGTHQDYDKINANEI